jgi:glutamate synthase domain-containing protein 2
MQCGFSTLSHDTEEDKICADHNKCVACHRCMIYCPHSAITIERNTHAYQDSGAWPVYLRERVFKQASTGGVLLTGMGNAAKYESIFDHLVLDACQVTNPSIDPLREPMELRTYLGSKPDALEFERDNGSHTLKTYVPPQIRLETPIIFSPMSLGAVSLPVQKCLAMAAEQAGTFMNTGEGGLHKDLYPYAKNIIVQVASGRFGVFDEYLRAAAAIEIKIGQGAKPGIGGHLPGEKVDDQVAATRMIPTGTDALSPAPHHDIYSIEDLRQLIFALKEVVEYSKPISVKIACVHNVAAIACGIARAGADIIYLDGFRGSTGAAPTIIRDHVGIPIELAVATVDERLRQEGLRSSVSIIAAGSIRSSADAAKAIALGADACAIGTAALIALGCRVCMKCYTGNCSWGITSQRPELSRRIDPREGSVRLANLLRAWSLELKEILGALGVNSVESLRGSRERLRGVGLDGDTLEILGVKPAGVGY